MPAVGRPDGKYITKAHWAPGLDHGRRKTVCGRFIAERGVAHCLEDVTCKVCRMVLNLPEPQPEKHTLRVEVRMPVAERAAQLVGGTVRPAHGSEAYKVIEVETGLFADTAQLREFLRRSGIRAWDEPNV